MRQVFLNISLGTTTLGLRSGEESTEGGLFGLGVGDGPDELGRVLLDVVVNQSAVHNRSTMAADNKL